jgi:hypothetical protein
MSVDPVTNGTAPLAARAVGHTGSSGRGCGPKHPTMAEQASADRAALAFSAIRPRDAMQVSERLSVGERIRLREGMQRVRNAPDEARADALARLIAAVRTGTVFPAPQAHDEESCPFRRMERVGPELLGHVLQRTVVTEPLAVAVALCHFSPELRDALWAAIPVRTRSTMRRMLGQVPAVSHARTRRFAAELDAAVRRASRIR